MPEAAKHGIVGLTPEFRLAVDCCRLNFGGAAKARNAGEVDWDLFLDLVRFHRVEGLAWNALSASPSGAPDAVVA